MSSAEQPQKLITLDDIPGMTAERKAAVEAQTRRPESVPVPLSEFKGNPLRALGFPQEFVRPAVAGSAEYQQGSSEVLPQEVTSVGEKAVQAVAEGIITHVPFSSAPEQPIPAPHQPLITEVPRFDR
jgi:hypothetical protein